MVVDAKTYERFIKNTLRLSALILLYSAIVWVGAKTPFGIAVSVFATMILWSLLFLRSHVKIKMLEPMLLPACLICSAITGFSIFRFVEGLENDVIASCFLLGLAAAFLFAIIKLFSAPAPQ